MTGSPEAKILELLPKILYVLPSYFLLGEKTSLGSELDIILLRVLKRGGPCSVRELQRKLDWNKITYKRISARLKVLEAKGFIKDTPQGRTRIKKITPYGKKILDKIETKRKEYIRPILRLLASSQQQKLADFMEKVLKVIAEESDKKP